MTLMRELLDATREKREERYNKQIESAKRARETRAHDSDSESDNNVDNGSDSISTHASHEGCDPSISMTSISRS